MALLSYKFRLYPNRVQVDALTGMLGAFCDLYNAVHFKRKGGGFGTIAASGRRDDLYRRRRVVARRLGSGLSENPMMHKNEGTNVSWSEALRQATRDAIDPLCLLANAPCGVDVVRFKHVGGATGIMTMLDLAWGRLRLVDWVGRKTVFADADELLRAGWVVDFRIKAV